MESYYGQWDKNYDAYSNKAELTKEDIKARERREPVTTVVPMSRAQVLTFVTVCLNTLLQRPRLFELEGVGPEDVEPARVAEALLDNDLRHNNHIRLLWQWLLNIAIFGVGIFKVAYTKTTSKRLVRVETQPPTFMGNALGAPQTELRLEDVTDFVGNVIEVISPYNFFPDPTVAISDFQKGQFVASESWIGRHILANEVARGNIVGLEFVQTFNVSDESNRRRMPSDLGPDVFDVRYQKDTNIVLVTEVQLELIPAQTSFGGIALGTENTPSKWLVWIANDDRVIRFEPLGFAHNRFTYEVAELYPDVRYICNDGLVGSIAHLQDVANWLLNAHITNVRKVVGDRLVVKSSFVELEDLKARAPVIRIKEEASDFPIDDVIKQLSVVDVTTRHVQDAQILMDLAQQMTGVTDTAMGMFHTGRRSAREAAAVASYTGARLRIPTLQMFETCLIPLARQMLANHQQFLDVELLVRAVGEETNPNSVMRFIRASRDKIVGSFDFVVMDATTPTERGVIASAIGELMTSLPGGLQTLLSLGYDPQKILNEWMILMGIKHPERFKLDQERAKELVNQVLASNMLYGQRQPTLGEGQPTEPVSNNRGEAGA